jgi:hypothetical protein
VLQVPDHVASSRLRRLEARFLDWYAWTVDLPGVYFLQVVEQGAGVTGKFSSKRLRGR